MYFDKNKIYDHIDSNYDYDFNFNKKVIEEKDDGLFHKNTNISLTFYKFYYINNLLI